MASLPLSVAAAAAAPACCSSSSCSRPPPFQDTPSAPAALAHRQAHTQRLSVVARSSQRLDPAPRSVGSWWPWLTHGSSSSGGAGAAGGSAALTSSHVPQSSSSPTVSSAVNAQEPPERQWAASPRGGAALDAGRAPLGPSRARGQQHSTSRELEGSEEGVALYLQQLLQVDGRDGALGLASPRLPGVLVRFCVPEYVSAPGQQLVIVGSVPALGSWDIEQGARMAWHPGHRWTAEVRLEPGWHGALEFKVAMVDRSSHVWEPGSNRLLVVERPRQPSLPASSNGGGGSGKKRRLQSRLQASGMNGAQRQWAATGPASPRADGGRSSAQAAAGQGDAPLQRQEDEEPQSGRAGAGGGPVLDVECLWGKAEAPAPPLPPSLLCSPTKMGVLANGQPLAAGGSSGAPTSGAPAWASVVMAHCQVVVPQLDPALTHPSGGGGGAAPADDGAAALASPAVPSAGGGAGSSPSSLQLVLVGSVPALGCWDPAQGLRLAMDDAGMWRGSLELPMGYPVQAKLALWDAKAQAVRAWEPGGNRHIRLPEPPASARTSGAVLTPLQPGGAQSANGAGALAAAAPGASPALGGGPDGLCCCDDMPAARTAGAPCWPVMQDGEFMLLTHWGIPSFPHLVFLPALLDLPPQQSSPSRVLAAAAPAGAGEQLPPSLAGPQSHPLQPASADAGAPSSGGGGGGGRLASVRKLPSSVVCRFMVPHLPTQPHQHLLLVGSTPKLGNWDPTRGLKLQWGPGHSWQGSVPVPSEDLHETVEAKVVLWDGQAYRWEAGPNRSLRPAELLITTGVVPRGAWGEVLYILYPALQQQGGGGGRQGGAATSARHNATGRTPAVVIPQDLAAALAGAASSAASSASRSLQRQQQQRALRAGGAEPGGAAGAHGGSGAGQGTRDELSQAPPAPTLTAAQEPTVAVLQMVSGLAALALHAAGSAAAGDALLTSPGRNGMGANGHAGASSGAGAPSAGGEGGAAGSSAASSASSSSSPSRGGAHHGVHNGGVVAAAAAQQHAQVVAGLEAAVEQLRTQVAEANSLRQKEVEALRKQLAEASKALASEEDEVEVLHAQLAARAAELRGMQQQLARAEATATAAVAAATTALSSTTAAAAAGNGVTLSHVAMYGSSGSSVEDDGLVGEGVAAGGGGGGGAGASSLGSSNGHLSTPQQQHVSHVAAATFQKLTEQMAVLQLEADTARRSLAEAHAAWGAEVAHLRAEVSEAVAQRHKEAECARLASATAALTYQQEVAALQASLADTHAAHQRELAAAQARAEAVAAAAANETSRLARQLAQACAAAEALEAQLMAQRAATASLSASGSSELRRLRALLHSQAHELDLLRGQLADGHAAAAVGKLSAAHAPPAAAPSGAPAAGGAAAVDAPPGAAAPGGAQAWSSLAAAGPSSAAASSEEDEAPPGGGVPAVPSHLADVMAEVRAAKAALESAARNTPGAGPLPLVNLGLGPKSHPVVMGPPGGASTPSSNGSSSSSNGLHPHLSGAPGGGSSAAGKLNNIVPLLSGAQAGAGSSSSNGHHGGDGKGRLEGGPGAADASSAGEDLPGSNGNGHGGLA